MTTYPVCFSCRYFRPEGLDYADELTEDDWDACMDGECRRNPPQVGDFIKAGTIDEERWYGNFPRVMACDWCGAYEPCQTREEDLNDTCL